MGVCGQRMGSGVCIYITGSKYDIEFYCQTMGFHMKMGYHRITQSDNHDPEWLWCDLVGINHTIYWIRYINVIHVIIPISI